MHRCPPQLLAPGVVVGLAAQAAVYQDVLFPVTPLPLPRGLETQTGWAALPDELLARIMEAAKAGDQASLYSLHGAPRGAVAAPMSRLHHAAAPLTCTLRLVCRAWRRIHDERMVTFLKPAVLYCEVLAARFPGLTALDLSRHAGRPRTSSLQPPSRPSMPLLPAHLTVGLAQLSLLRALREPCQALPLAAHGLPSRPRSEQPPPTHTHTRLPSGVDFLQQQQIARIRASRPRWPPHARNKYPDRAKLAALLGRLPALRSLTLKDAGAGPRLAGAPAPKAAHMPPLVTRRMVVLHAIASGLCCIRFRRAIARLYH